MAWTITNNNPGAIMLGGQQTAYPDVTSGIAAQVANWNTPRYQGQTLSAATNMWVNGDYSNTSQNSASYAQYLANAAGVSVNSPVDQNLITNPNFLAAQAQWEAGKAFPATAQDWANGIAAGISGAAPSAALGASATGSIASAGASAASALAPGAAGWMDWLGHQFIRGAVVVLGFIFVGAGLGMFAIGILANPESIPSKLGTIGENRLRRKSMKAGIKAAETPIEPPHINVTNLVRQPKEPGVSARRRLLREGKLPALAKAKRKVKTKPGPATNITPKALRTPKAKAKKGSVIDVPFSEA